MDIRIHPEFLERLSNIDWFSRIFEPDEISTSPDYIYVESWDKAKPLFCSVEWETAANEASNALSGYVGTKFPDLFQSRWNDILLDEIYPWIEAQVEPFIRETMKRYDLDTRFFYNALEDIVYIILEDVYRDTNPPSLFFAELLKFYKAGHFPCGWKNGRWPKGTLMVA